jgi:uncharacterized phage protein (TIGR02220 family)
VTHAAGLLDKKKAKRKFRKIDPRIWNDEKFRLFSDDEKLGFLFVLTHPHLTALGAMRSTLEGLAAELGWQAGRLRRALERPIQTSMIEYDPDAAFVSLPKFLKYNEPEGPNSVKFAWKAALDLIPECQGKQRLIARCREYLDGMSDDFKKAIGDAIWHAFPDATADANRVPMSHPGAGAGAGAGAIPPRAPKGAMNRGPGPDELSWLELLNREAGRKFKPIEANLRHIRARIREHFTLDQAEEVVKTKVREWKGTDRDEYLRPATLFGGKFDGYLQATLNSNGHVSRQVTPIRQDGLIDLGR